MSHHVLTNIALIASTVVTVAVVIGLMLVRSN